MSRSDEDTGSKQYEPIAIIGIGCRFPGGVETPQQFWDLLVAGKDGTGEVPPSRWDLEKFYDENRAAEGKLYTKRGGFLTDVTGFDPQFFGISPREAAYMDPQQRLLLETTWEAFEDAGLPPKDWAHKKVGIFVGLFTHDYENIHMQATESGLYSSHSATGMSTTIAANRLSYAFDFTGPSMVVDTACSSSLVAVHLACQSLHSGEAEIAVAGGVNLQLTPQMTMALCNASMLAPDGRCKSFDARANGYARADGAGMVVLKPLSKALADGDPIYALVQGSAVNQDGRSKGITVPSKQSQQVVMRAALARAELDAIDISYIEAHGTGTPVGDPIEAGALGGVLSAGHKNRPHCVLGSVKSNFGHTESAAGVAGLIKVALMQKHGVIPPNLHFEMPNPDIAFDQLRLRVPTALEAWPTDEKGRRFAGLNSFGFGGTNAHLVIGAAPIVPEVSADADVTSRPVLTCLSARSAEALLDNARQHAAFFRRTAQNGDTQSLADLAAHLAFGREHHAHRMTISASDFSQAADMLEAFAEGNRRLGVAMGVAKSDIAPELVFVCSGMGQQWWAMARELLESEPVFAAKIDELDGVFSRLTTDWSVRAILTASQDSSEIDKTEYAQPAIFSVQMALAALFATLGVKPQKVVGHSIGEIAAACIAGALSVEDAARVCFHRSRLQAQLAGHGSMLAVGLPASAVKAYIVGMEAEVSIAAINSPESVTLAGDTAQLDVLRTQFEAENVFARMLNVEVPYHSPAMADIRDAFLAAIAGITPRTTQTTLISTVTGKVIDGRTLDAAYWYDNIREPVVFADAMTTLMAGGEHLFMEIGAHPVLASSISECLAAQEGQGAAIAPLRRKQDATLTFWSAVGQLHCLGYGLDFATFLTRKTAHAALPTYPWQRAAFWTESAASRKNRTGFSAEGAMRDHPLLGERQSAPHPAWRSELTSAHPAYLSDHCVQGSVVYPGAGYIEMALAAGARMMAGTGVLVLEKFKIDAALVFTEQKRVALHLSTDDDQAFEIHSQTGKQDEARWQRHASGRILSQALENTLTALDIEALQKRLPNMQNKAAFYDGFGVGGLSYGPQFQNVQKVWSGTDEALGRIKVSDDMARQLEPYILHPAILDAGFQLLAGLPGDGAFLPVGIERIEVREQGADIAWAHCRLVSRSDTRLIADITLADENGKVLVQVSGLACQLFEDADSRSKIMESGYLYDRMWVYAPLAGVDLPRRHAGFLPNPEALVAPLQARHNARDVEKTHQKFIEKGWPALDALATAYIVVALRDLGLSWQNQQSFTTTQLLVDLGISPKHEQLLHRMLTMLAQSGYLVSNAEAWEIGPAPDDLSIDYLRDELLRNHPNCHSEMMLVHRSGVHLDAFLRDEAEPLTAVFPTNSPLAEQFYADAPTFKFYMHIVCDAVDEMVRALPEGESLRILEIGAGTGGLASHLLPRLPAARVDYHFTDVSMSFANHAQKRFKAYPFVHYGVLDIEADLVAQGYETDSFDIIVVSDALHATKDLRTTLSAVKDLLVPGGLLTCIELTSQPRWGDLVFGLLPGWWLFEDKDLRQQNPTLPAKLWENVMSECGFEQATHIGDKFAFAQGLHSVLLARKPLAIAPVLSPERAPQNSNTQELAGGFVILADALGIAQALEDELTSQGAYVATIRSAMADKGVMADALNEAIAAVKIGHNQAPIIVDLRWLAAPSAFNASDPGAIAEENCLGVQAVVQLLAETDWVGRPRLWVVTNGTETVGNVVSVNVVQGAVKGFTRVVMNEYGDLDTYLVDLSPQPEQVEIAGLARELVSNQAEIETVFRGDRRFVNRVVRHRNMVKTFEPQASYALRSKGQSAASDLIFEETKLAAPAPGEVQVKVYATGLNYKDFALLQGMIDASIGTIGLEGAGVVQAIGEGVDGFSPGDVVMGLLKDGVNSPINTPAHALVHKPKHLSFEDAAGIPICYVSAYHGLHKQARLQKGETVLIHAAASGLGLAAIQVAQALGATVLATAGNDEKRDYLRSLGIAYVGDSRSSNFAKEIMTHTAGRGVDVVFNTLPAEMNAFNIDLLQPATGRLLDLSNLHYGAQLDFAALKKGIAVSAFDLSILAGANPAYVTAVLSEMMPLFVSGQLSPVPYRTVPLNRVSEAIRNFRKASHIGKIIVSHRDDILPVRPTQQDLPLAKDGSYLITGGLTGFGLATAQWLVKCGVQHLVLVGRRGATTPDAQEALAAFKAQGVAVEAIACDVADLAQVKALIDRFGDDFPVLKGIIHAAMVMRDGPIRTMTRADLRDVLTPKIAGAWNLHLSTLDQKLDFFILYSSISNLIGNRDQANYAAANDYLETLARYRQTIGLPGLALGWGTIGSIGYVARDKEVQSIFERQGVYPLQPDEAWTAMQYGVRAGLPYLGAIATDWSKLKKFSRSVSVSHRFKALDLGDRGGKSREQQADDKAEALRADATPEEKLAYLQHVVAAEIAGVLGIKPDSLDVDRPLPDLGFDSLMAVELSVALENATGHGFHRMSLLRPDLTTAHLVREIATNMGDGQSVLEPSSPPKGETRADTHDIQVQDLSDSEVEALLRELAVEE